MKTKRKLPKFRKPKFLDQDNVRSCEFSVPMGRIYVYVTREKNNRFSYEVYWHNYENGSDTTIVLSKKKDWTETFDEAIYLALGSAKDYFYDSEEYNNLVATIDKLDDLSYDLRDACGKDFQ